MFTGTIQRAATTIVGRQDAETDITGAGTDRARLTLTWGRLRMSFSSAEQVDVFATAFAAIRPDMVGMKDDLSAVHRDEFEAMATNTTVLSWHQTPTWTVVPQQRVNQRTRTLEKFVDLLIGPLALRVVDAAAWRGGRDILAAAHAAARVCFPDGHQLTSDPFGSDDDINEPQ